jgi:hypothetical protein
MIKFSELELEKIAEDASDKWVIVATNNKGERRWGFDEEVVFTSKDGTTPFYAFTYYCGAGDAEIDFEPSNVYTVFPKEVTITEWVKVNEWE